MVDTFVCTTKLSIYFKVFDTGADSVYIQSNMEQHTHSTHSNVLVQGSSVIRKPLLA